MTGNCGGRRFSMVLIHVVAIGVFLLTAAALAHAQGPNSVNGPSSILDEYKGLQNGWITKLLGAAQRLFFLLAGIEVAWSFTLLAIEKADFQALTAAIVRKIMWIGIFYAILLYGVTPGGGGWIAARDFDKEEEVFDLRHHFSVPVSLDVNRLVYRLTLAGPGRPALERELDIPLLRYEQKTKLTFPIKGKFMVVLGHDFNEPHSLGRSQHFAYDIFGMGPHWELTRNSGATNADFYTWGREVIAPADGEVVYSRNDVPDQPRPGTVDRSIYMNMPNPGYANPGNHVLLNHYSNEYSSLGHMQHGSVRVRTGDRVKRGDVVGLAGSAGDSELPHLHYQLTDGEHLFLVDGLPSRFENVSLDLLGNPIKIATPKRGVPLEAH